jgi:hypothetical protein
MRFEVVACLIVLLVATAAGCMTPPQNGALSFDGRTVAPTPPDGEGTGGAGQVGGGGGGGSSVVDIPDAAPEVASADTRADLASSDLSLPRDGGGCQLNTTVTTMTRNQNYAPRNIGAIWIGGADGTFIKSLNVWAANRRSHLNRWIQVTGAAGLAQNRVDAVTSATKSSDGTRLGSWDCTNTAHQLVPDGAYQVCFELNEGNGTSRFNCVSFNKGPVAVELRPPDSPGFLARVIAFSP